MKIEETIYCMESYIDDDSYEHCTSCPYYGKHKIDENTYVCESSKAHRMAVKALSEQRTGQDVLDKIRAEIEQKIEQERFARSVFRGEEKDAVKAEQCTGSIFAYNNVIELIDKYNKAESEG